MNARVAIVVLAAGAGRRFGRPKALAETEGRAWLEVGLARAAEAGLDRATIVVGARAEEVLRRFAGLVVPGLTLSWVRNEVWREGRSTSIVRGLRDLAGDVDGALLHSVDHPDVQARTFRRLIDRFAETGDAPARIILPVTGGRRGHPILIGRAVWQEIERLGPDEPLRRVVHRDDARLVEVAVEDPGIHRNRNRPLEED